MEPSLSEEGSSETGDRDHNERELATKVLNIQAKRFYVDVKENQRGRFIKLAEVAAGRRKNRIIFPMSITAEFRDRLTEFQQASDQIGPTAPTPLPEDGKLHSVVIVKDFRRYYLDLKENERGRFVRVSLISRGARSQIGIPAQGILRLRDAFTELIEEFGNQEEHEEERVPFRGELPKSRSIRVENKTFYFDVDQNNRGMFMKISEVKPNFRSSITIPERSWGKMRDIISEYMLDIRSEAREQDPVLPPPSHHQQPPRSGGAGAGAGAGPHAPPHPHPSQQQQQPPAGSGPSAPGSAGPIGHFPGSPGDPRGGGGLGDPRGGGGPGRPGTSSQPPFHHHQQQHQHHPHPQQQHPQQQQQQQQQNQSYRGPGRGPGSSSLGL
ncbi:putative Transcriptional activator protein Pur-alpha [Hypsibius exemplaris]|uniref:Transcriptional activator protein Pur-alpha n=1 Tax=Hypsibius exemplaris TaxID=2072580 RepID=A0A9X6NBN4_HYPEX|nr:putative Transcriptional activator protein Pur-alpha [Hypsibius exemplaris]